MTVSLGEHIHHTCVQFRMLRGTARRYRWVVFLVGVEVLYEPDELLAQAAAPLSPLTDAQSDLGLGHAAFRQGWCWRHGSESGRPEEMRPPAARVGRCSAPLQNADRSRIAPRMTNCGCGRTTIECQ